MSAVREGSPERVVLITFLKNTPIIFHLTISPTRAHMDPTRALLDSLQSDSDKEEDGEEEEKHDAAQSTSAFFVLPATRLQRILETPLNKFADVVRVMGTHYRFLMSTEVYVPDGINHIDTMWLMLAKKLALEKPDGDKAMDPKLLRDQVTRRLSHALFAPELLRCRRQNLLSNRLLPMMWRTLESLSPRTNEEHRTIMRACTRWIAAMCYVHVYVVGHRSVEVVDAPHPHTVHVQTDLRKLLVSRTKTLPDVFHDGLVANVRALHLSIDAAVVYEALHPSHGECDLHLAMKAATGLDTQRMDALCRWVPWPRPVPKPGETLVGVQAPQVIDRPPVWLVELWQLRVFSFFFHSAFGEATGYIPRLGGEGLFLERYVVSWWELLLPSGLVKLETSHRFHTAALPLIIPVSQTQCWLRTASHIFIHPSFASALAAWLETCKILEDGVHVWAGCSTFMPSLPEPVPDINISETSSMMEGESQIDLEL